MGRSGLVEPDLHFLKLRPGPGLSAETVQADQRRRLHGAILKTVIDGGWREVRVRDLVRTAGVSSSSFYKQFVNADECLASALDAAVSDLVKGSEIGSGAGLDWHESIKLTVSELLDRFGSNQEAARVALVDSFTAGPSARKRAGILVTRLEETLSACFSASPERVSTPRHLIAGMAGGVLRVLRATVASGRARELPALTEPLTEWLVSLPSPVVLTLPVAQADRPPARVPSNPLHLLDGNPADDRRRLLQTAMRLASEHGFAALTAPRVRRDAGVPRRQFDRFFLGVDDCFLNGIDAVVESSATGANHHLVENWTFRTHRMIAALCSDAAENRRLARVTLLEIFAPGRDGLLRREKILESAAAALRRTVPREERPSRLAAEASVAAAWHVAQADVLAGRARDLPSIAPLLSYLVLAPIVGPGSAVGAIRADTAEGTLLKT